MVEMFICVLAISMPLAISTLEGLGASKMKMVSLS